MISKIFAVFDVKAGAYMSPFFCGSRGLALRSFSEIATDGKSSIFKYPADFTLFELGEYDDETGFISMHETLVNLGNAIEYVSKEVVQ